MSVERASSQHGNLNSPQSQEYNVYVELNNDQRNIIPSKLMKTVKSLNAELQSFKDDNMKDRQGQQEVNVFLLYTIT